MKHRITVNSKEKAERIILSAVRSHKVSWREAFSEIHQKTSYIIWYEQR